MTSAFLNVRKFGSTMEKTRIIRMNTTSMKLLLMTCQNLLWKKDLFFIDQPTSFLRFALSRIMVLMISSCVAS